MWFSPAYKVISGSLEENYFSNIYGPARMSGRKNQVSSLWE